jgi:hypothetical protein
MSRQFFEDNFYPAYLAMRNDKVTNVRLDFAKSLPAIKPYLDSKSQINTDFIESILILKNDSNKEVAEATEDSDFELLKSRKKIL